ncbi:Protein of unknown function [Cupriavidus sp. OV038]|nr:Protein of unknown function [Cupriavidus sp. OV038]SFP75351.1 Protein of unknown function [Cupriavidus sp. OV096]
MNMGRLLLLRWLLPLLVVTGCDAFSSTPTYGGLSVAGFNYTPYNLTRFVIRDEFGNTAGGGGDLQPGSGEGRLSCCYQLKGTEFTVEWDLVDQNEFLKDIYAPIKEIRKVARVHLAPTKLAGGVGERVLGLHFYPDDHVEFEFRNDLRGTRFFYAEIDDWLYKKQGKVYDPESSEDAAAFIQTARIASEGWLKYRLTNTDDLKQYVYFTLLINPRFDTHPAIEKILTESRGKPGAFAAAMEKLPSAVLQDLKRMKEQHANKGPSHG